MIVVSSKPFFALSIERMSLAQAMSVTYPASLRCLAMGVYGSAAFVPQYSGRLRVVDKRKHRYGGKRGRGLGVEKRNAFEGHRVHIGGQAPPNAIQLPCKSQPVESERVIYYEDWGMHFTQVSPRCSILWHGRISQDAHGV